MSVNKLPAIHFNNKQAQTDLNTDYMTELSLKRQCFSIMLFTFFVMRVFGIECYYFYKQVALYVDTSTHDWCTVSHQPAVTSSTQLSSRQKCSMYIDIQIALPALLCKMIDYTVTGINVKDVSPFNGRVQDAVTKKPFSIVSFLFF